MTEQQPLVDALRVELGRENAAPLYQRVQNGIRRAMDQGTLDANDAIPSERDLATQLGVSRITVRRAVKGLVDEGLLNQRQGAGTFVSPRVEQPLSELTGYTEDMTSRGMTPGVEWLQRSMGRAMPEEALALELEPGAEVARLYRLRTADGRPMCLEHATLPSAKLPDPENVEASLYSLLGERGLRPNRALQTIRAELFGIEHARLLSVQPGSACLYIERRSFLADGSAIEFVCSHYRGDSYDFVAELQF